ncbi:unnamed protein product [Paramecium primaurelia]|uniref:Uncharacterized protein n=1 Tax=Paramecium primaurelia TaxID=5886 RepID=A0A8S1NQK1_PARPR|nr:unnamed protein product [Paramecium primaurelia]
MMSQIFLDRIVVKKFQEKFKEITQKGKMSIIQIKLNYSYINYQTWTTGEQ